MSKDIIVILGLALVVVAGWISLDLYKAFTKTEAPVVSEEMLQPVDPDLDFEVINDLKSRLNFYSTSTNTVTSLAKNEPSG